MSMPVGAGFLYELSPYLNKYGVYNNMPSIEPVNTVDVDTGNAILLASEIIEVALQNGYKKEDLEEIHRRVREAAEYTPGLIHRVGKPEDSCSHDEFLGYSNILQVFTLCGSKPVSDQVDLLGWKLSNPFRLDRFVWFPVHIEVTQNKEINLVNQIIWSAHIIYTAWKHDGAGGTLMAWLMVQAYRRSTKPNAIMTIASYTFDKIVKNMTFYFAEYANSVNSIYVILAKYVK